ncbi:TrbC/VirB2 family protein [Parasphingorhabdus sp.]|jgi:type IV secretory pathway VirB2 component (pilin)|uniref:TrbC/VirB2 family protein n=1 Tax=Parasphingorhabdus sp. TaxID=2709688 RepID=UPI003BB05EDE
MSIGAGSVLAPKHDYALLEAAHWIDGVLLGPIATFIAIVAVALLGFAMLMGRINIRRALSVLLGCFLLFGARGIAEGLRSVGGNEVATPPLAAGPPPPIYPNLPKAHGGNSNAFDPYAGAAVIRSAE